MQTPIVNENLVRRSIAEPDDFAHELASSGAPQLPPRETTAPPAWEATVAPRRSVA